MFEQLSKKARHRPLSGGLFVGLTMVGPTRQFLPLRGNRGIPMKKTYVKPELLKRECLGSIAAQLAPISNSIKE